MNLLLEAIKTYDLLQTHFPKTWVQAFVANNYMLGNVVTVVRDEMVRGVAIAWPIEDPLEINDLGDYPGRCSDGKYLYIPMIFIRDDDRLKGEGIARSSVLSELIQSCFRKFPSAKKIAFRRTKHRKVKSGSGRARTLKRDTRRLHIIRRAG